MKGGFDYNQNKFASKWWSLFYILKQQEVLKDNILIYQNFKLDSPVPLISNVSNIHAVVLRSIEISASQTGHVSSAMFIYIKHKWEMKIKRTFLPRDLLSLSCWFLIPMWLYFFSDLLHPGLCMTSYTWKSSNYAER